MFEAIAFYFFSAILIASAIMVIAGRNPVHSVLFLILAFFNAAGLFVLMGAEFLGMILIVVYVGAVAVLFLFVVMMLDIDFADLKRGTLQYLPFGVLIGLILVAELVMVGSVWALKPATQAALDNATPADITNTEALGRILYTDYVYYFQIAGLVLLVAMIGAIVLTLRGTPTSKRQDVGKQVARSGSVNLRQPPLGAGLGEIGIERPPADAPAEAPRQVAHGGGHH
jgi:NADH-quinone oxidoreductase subunit J